MCGVRLVRMCRTGQVGGREVGLGMPCVEAVGGQVCVTGYVRAVSGGNTTH